MEKERNTETEKRSDTVQLQRLGRFCDREGYHNSVDWRLFDKRYKVRSEAVVYRVLLLIVLRC